MLLHLGDEGALDPGRAGAKAAWLARGLRAGLPILEGVVVPAEASRGHLAAAGRLLSERGSGAARLATTGASLDPALRQELHRVARDLGGEVVVRSSSVLEGSGEWSGAFASYVGVSEDEVEKAVLGCWASAFTVAALARFEAAGTRPDAHPMPVLVQPALHLQLGGTAWLEGDEVVVVVVEGSPAPLVQGWVSGRRARVAADGTVEGDQAMQLMGGRLLERLATTVRSAGALGATSCEWGVSDGELRLLQLGRRSAAPPRSQQPATGLADPRAVPVARLVRRHPGPLGEALVLPWALGDPAAFLDPVEPLAGSVGETLRAAREEAGELTSQVWEMPPADAARAAAELIRMLRGPEPEAALNRMEQLRSPDRGRGGHVRGLLAGLGCRLVELRAVSHPEAAWHLDPELVGRVAEQPSASLAPPRLGFQRWEPFDASVLIGTGRTVMGTVASPGLGAGRLCLVTGPTDAARFRPRDVLVAVDPVPNLAPLLWDAAGVVTVAGSPAAHLFESARALGIPAVCSIPLEEALGTSLEGASGSQAAAVDGGSGRVHVDRW